MKDTIYTIPVSEVFEPREGCPICRMRDTLEERCLEYIMGAAMMEPDVRQETNKVGFCADHFQRMLPRKNRLAIGLMLQSHLDYIDKEIVSARAPGMGKDKRPALGEEIREGCYICGRVKTAMDRMLDNMLGMWVKEESFRTLFAEQEYVCFTHYSLLTQAASLRLPKKQLPLFMEAVSALTKRRLLALKADVDSFCTSFDYRAARDGPLSQETKTSLERSAAYLTSREMT